MSMESLLAEQAFKPSRASGARPRADPARAQILGVGTATHAQSYSQAEVLDAFQVDDRRLRLLFRNSAIDRRHLLLPQLGPDGKRTVETQGGLLGKHARFAVEMGSHAIAACLRRIGADLRDIDFLCCVTTTGFLTPGLSALLCRHLQLRQDLSRIDIVGMGCNAGLNGMTATDAWSRANPGKLAVMLCVEICSAAYVFDTTMSTAVVNSLFGDGASAVALRTPTSEALDEAEDAADSGMDAEQAAAPSLVGFASRVIPDAIDAMRYVWDENHGKFSFQLAQDIPYVVGANVEDVVGRLLRQAGLRRSDIAHWIVHSGGKKVIDSVKVNLGLSPHDVRHTSSVLRDFGNVSSGSFLFSYERLLEEGTVRPGDHGVMMTMGPGTTIETALLKW